MPTYPRPEHAEHHIAAWLSPDEERMFLASECRDIRQRIRTSIYMEEARKKKRPTHADKMGPRTPEGEARRAEASRLLESAQIGAFSYGTMLIIIAQTRRKLHYALLGQTPPEIPATEEE